MNGWKAWALAGMTGLALGGGIGTYTGHAAAERVRVNLEKRIEQLEEENRSDIETQIEMAVAIARIETKVDYLIQRMEEER